MSSSWSSPPRQSPRGVPVEGLPQDMVSLGVTSWDDGFIWFPQWTKHFLLTWRSPEVHDRGSPFCWVFLAWNLEVSDIRKYWCASPFGAGVPRQRRYVWLFFLNFQVTWSLKSCWFGVSKNEVGIIWLQFDHELVDDWGVLTVHLYIIYDDILICCWFPPRWLRPDGLHFSRGDASPKLRSALEGSKNSKARDLVVFSMGQPLEIHWLIMTNHLFFFNHLMALNLGIPIEKEYTHWKGITEWQWGLWMLMPHHLLGTRNGVISIHFISMYTIWKYMESIGKSCQISHGSMAIFQTGDGSKPKLLPYIFWESTSIHQLFIFEYHLGGVFPILQGPSWLCGTHGRTSCGCPGSSLVVGALWSNSRPTGAATTAIYIHTYIHIYIYIHTYIHIHIYIYIHTYIYTYIHTYTHIHIYIYTYIYIYIHTYIHTYTHIYTYIHTYTYIYIHTYIHIHTYIYIYIYIHTYTYIYIHTYIYIYIYVHCEMYTSDPLSMSGIPFSRVTCHFKPYNTC